MVYCSKCGNELPENAYFCPKCGVKTARGAQDNVSVPYRDMFEELGKQLEQDFIEISNEMKKAFDKAKEEIKKASQRGIVICPSCGEKNYAGDSFCFKCGKKLS